MQEFLDHFPVVTFGVVLIIVVGAIKSIVGDLDFGQFVDYVAKVGVGGGAIGAARGIAAHARN